jgi:hypothetical protein
MDALVYHISPSSKKKYIGKSEMYMLDLLNKKQNEHLKNANAKFNFL